MKILLVGTVESIDNIVYAVKDYDLEISALIVNDSTLMKDTIKEIPKNIDGIFASGIGIYNQIVQNFNTDLPLHYAQRGVVSLSEALLNYIRDGKGYKKPSFDVIGKELIDDIINEYKIEFNEYIVLNNDMKKDESSFLKEHLNLYNEGVIDCVFTAYGYAYYVLKNQGIPVYRLMPTKYDIQSDVDYLIMDIKNNNNLKNTLVVYNFAMDSSVQSNIEFMNNFINTIDGVLVDSKDSIVVSNRGRVSYQDTLIKNLEYELLANENNIKVSVSTGETLQKAIENSKRAKQFLTEEYPVVFYNGNKLEKHSLDNEKESLSTMNIDIIANETGILKKHLIKISLNISVSANNVKTTTELSDLLGLTKRTAIRIMDSLIEYGYAKEIKSYANSTGRPQRSIEILF